MTLRADVTRLLAVSNTTVVDCYGDEALIAGSGSQAPPSTPSGHFNRALFLAVGLIGRLLCGRSRDHHRLTCRSTHFDGVSDFIGPLDTFQAIV